MLEARGWKPMISDDNIDFRNVINLSLRFFTELWVTQKNFTKNHLQEWGS
ncbi:hypothetical protein ARTHRO_11012 [Limnospira indica PCC 8005]|uniref:Uncharacterized protein n=1 Tax=Limnospira indica PCC 8005 TaxID=376219 RepID=A0A9P1KDD9_9CYAN|nr:hypothetical protein ARTHRO_11012 [Limnospira indica PCC 8005]